MKFLNVIIFISLLSIQSLFADVDLKRCQTCHGINFEKKAFSFSKIVANMTQDEVRESLIGYKYKTYGKKFKKIMYAEIGRYSVKELSELKIGKEKTR